MEPQLVSPEVAAFRRHYDHLLRDAKDPLLLAMFLCSEGVISREVRDSITSASISDVEQGRAVLDAFQNALRQSSKPSATMRSLRTAFEKAGFDTYYSIRYVEEFVDGE